MLHNKRRFTQPQQLSRMCSGQRARFARIRDMSEQQSETSDAGDAWERELDAALHK